MKFNKKLLLSAVLITVSSASVLAATGSFTAAVSAYQEPTISQTTALNFGKIQTTATSVCNMDNAGALTGACDAAATHAAGVINITGLTASTAMNIKVTGSTTAGAGDLTFVATTDASDGTTNTTATADGVTAGFTTTAVPADINLTVYGSMTANNTLTNGTAYTVGYTVDVTFQ